MPEPLPDETPLEGEKANLRLLDMKELDFIERFLNTISPVNEDEVFMDGLSATCPFSPGPGQSFQNGEKFNDGIHSMNSPLDNVHIEYVEPALILGHNSRAAVPQSSAAVTVSASGPGRPSTRAAKARSTSKLPSTETKDSLTASSESDEDEMDGGRRKPLLDEGERRSRHIASEHKRRNRIKDEMQRMTNLIPSLHHSTVRISQAKLLAHANDYIEFLQEEAAQLKASLIRLDPDNLYGWRSWFLLQFYIYLIHFIKYFPLD